MQNRLTHPDMSRSSHAQDREQQHAITLGHEKDCDGAELASPYAFHLAGKREERFINDDDFVTVSTRLQTLVFDASTTTNRLVQWRNSVPKTCYAIR